MNRMTNQRDNKHNQILSFIQNNQTKIQLKDPNKSLIKILYYKTFHKVSNAVKVFNTNRIYNKMMIYNLMNLLRKSIKYFQKDLDHRKTGVLIKNNQKINSNSMG